jgi:hypothetical protein
MLPVKMECEFRMIHSREFPAFGRVTRSAVGSKLTVVMVILCMAGDTQLRSGFQIVQVVCIDMALGTGYWRMFSDQIERYFVMVKYFAV